MVTLNEIEESLASDELPSIPWLIEGLVSIQADTVEDVVDDKAKKKKTVELARKNACHLGLLKESLQAAVAIEFTTIPPYLCALWSIRDDLHPLAKSIREVVQEEMLHMILTCNMLAALGEQPRINSCVPEYPAELPRNVHPELTIKLSGLTRDALATFMQIERPEQIVSHGHDHDDADHAGSTIGRFYERIERAFDILKPELSTDCQIGGPPVAAAVVPTSLKDCIVEDVKEVKEAIEIIREQGEGSSKTPEDSGEDDLAHYYRFEEWYVGRKLERDPETGRYFHGKPMELPDVWPMAKVPAGGYEARDVSDEVQCLLERFDETYSSMLDLLQQTWQRGGQRSFVRSLELMFELEKYAKPLMRIPIKHGEAETFGPCFRYRGDGGKK